MAASSPARTLLFGFPAVLLAMIGVYLIGAFVAHYTGAHLDANVMAVVAGVVSLLLAMGVPLLLAGRVVRTIGPERVHKSAVRGTILALWNGALVGALVGAAPELTAQALRTGGTWIPGTAATPVETVASLVADQFTSVPQLEVRSGTDGPPPQEDRVQPVDQTAEESAVEIEVDGERVLSASELFERRADGVVVVKTRARVEAGNPFSELFEMMGASVREGHGSGFVVGPNLVVTNQHVIDQAEQMAILTRDGRTLGPVTALVVDADHDLALLRVEGLGLPKVPLASAEPLPPVGADTYAIGAPLGLSYSLTRGSVSAHRNVQGTDFLQMQTTVAPGSSGGPLFDDHGRVIAVNTATRYPGLNLAVQVRYVHDMLSALQSEQVFAAWTSSLDVTALEVEGLELRPTDREALANVMLQAGTVALDCVDTLPEDARIRVHTEFEMISRVDVSGNLGEAAHACAAERFEFVGFALRLTATQLGVTTPVTLTAVVADDARRLTVEVALGTAKAEDTDGAGAPSPERAVEPTP